MEIALEDGSLLGIDAKKKRYLVRCLAGCLYLTRGGDLRDYFLRPGEEMELRPCDDALLEAWGSTRVLCCRVPEPQDRRRPRVWHLSCY